jgi:hypothetical protein
MGRHPTGRKAKVATTSTPEMATQQDHDTQEEIEKLKGDWALDLFIDNTIHIRILEELARALEAKKDAEKAKAEAEKARSEAVAARKEAEQKAKGGDKGGSMAMIPKPRADEMTEGTDRLRRAMGLMDDKSKYLAIQVGATPIQHGSR